MDQPYRVEHLRPDQVDRAFILISPVAENVTLQQWRDRFKLGAPWGEATAHVAVDARGYVRGLSVSRPRIEGNVRLLDVPVFIAASAADASGVAGALKDHLKGVARAGQLDALWLWSPDSDSWRRFVSAGLEPPPDFGLLVPV